MQVTEVHFCPKLKGERANREFQFSDNYNFQSENMSTENDLGTQKLAFSSCF